MDIYRGRMGGEKLLFGYKVVTEDLRSLGLRGNPTIYTFTPQQWLAMPEHQLDMTAADYGGIWLCKRKGEARGLQRYCAKKHGLQTRVFLTYVQRILFENNSRFKTNAVYLDEEL